MILIIDNYDSFTYNLYQFIGTFESDICVERNDKITIEDIEKINPDSIVISPGPKSPKEAGICLEVIRTFAGRKPILGICLGHQCIGGAFGATVSYAKRLCHGRGGRRRDYGNEAQGISDCGAAVPPGVHLYGAWKKNDRKFCE